MLSLATIFRIAVLGLPAVATAAGTLGLALGIHKENVRPIHPPSRKAACNASGRSRGDRTLTVVWHYQ